MAFVGHVVASAPGRAARGLQAGRTGMDRLPAPRNGYPAGKRWQPPWMSSTAQSQRKSSMDRAFPSMPPLRRAGGLRCMTAPPPGCVPTWTPCGGIMAISGRQSPVARLRSVSCCHVAAAAARPEGERLRRRSMSPTGKCRQWRWRRDIRAGKQVRARNQGHVVSGDAVDCPVTWRMHPGYDIARARERTRPVRRASRLGLVPRMRPGGTGWSRGHGWLTRKIPGRNRLVPENGDGMCLSRINSCPSIRGFRRWTGLAVRWPVRAGCPWPSSFSCRCGD